MFKQFEFGCPKLFYEDKIESANCVHCMNVYNYRSSSMSISSHVCRDLLLILGTTLHIQFVTITINLVVAKRSAFKVNLTFTVLLHVVYTSVSQAFENLEDSLNLIKLIWLGFVNRASELGPPFIIIE